MNFSGRKTINTELWRDTRTRTHTHQSSKGNSNFLCLSGEHRALGSGALESHKLGIFDRDGTAQVAQLEDNNHSPGGLKQSGIILMV